MKCIAGDKMHGRRRARRARRESVRFGYVRARGMAGRRRAVLIHTHPQPATTVAHGQESPPPHDPLRRRSCGAPPARCASASAATRTRGLRAGRGMTADGRARPSRDGAARGAGTARARATAPGTTWARMGGRAVRDTTVAAGTSVLGSGGWTTSASSTGAWETRGAAQVSRM